MVQKVSSDKLQTYLCFICLKEEKPKVLETLRQFSFSVVSLGENIGTAAEATESYTKKIEALQKEIEEKEEKLKELAKEREKVEYVYDDLLIKRDRAKAVGDMINTKKVFCFDGWLPTQEADKVKKILDKYGCYYEISEPIKEMCIRDRLGYIKRTPRGRVVTEGGYSHFGLVKPSDKDSAQQIQLDL